MSTAQVRNKGWHGFSFVAYGGFGSSASPRAGAIVVADLVGQHLWMTPSVRNSEVIPHYALGPTLGESIETVEIPLGSRDLYFGWHSPAVVLHARDEQSRMLIRDIRETVEELDQASPWTVRDRIYERVWGEASVFIRGLRIPDIAGRFESRPFMISVSFYRANTGRGRVAEWARRNCTHRTDPARALCNCHRLALGRPLSFVGQDLKPHVESLYAAKLAAFLFGDDSVAQEVARSTEFFRETGWLPEEVESVLDSGIW